jgi:hypothetical protein
MEHCCSVVFLCGVDFKEALKAERFCCLALCFHAEGIDW